LRYFDDLDPNGYLRAPAHAQALQDVGIKDDHDGLDAGLWENIIDYNQSISSSMKLDQS